MRKTTGKKKSVLQEAIKEHVYNNIKEYIFASILILIGVFLGVVFVNNMSEAQNIEMGEYITNGINIIKSNGKINIENLLKKSISNNTIISLIMWFAGSTLIGIPIVLGIVIYRGFCISYTVSCLIKILGTGKGLIFSFTSVFLQNIFFIPAILAFAVTGIRLYKTIVKEKNTKNIKYELIRHTVISLMAFGIMLISSLIETYLSSLLFKMIIKYI